MTRDRRNRQPLACWATLRLWPGNDEARNPSEILESLFCDALKCGGRYMCRVSGNLRATSRCLG
jgi:hypothetical protein